LCPNFLSHRRLFSVGFLYAFLRRKYMSLESYGWDEYFKKHY